MALPSAAEVAQDWANKLAQSQSKIVAGINRVTENPMEKAAASADLWQQRVTDAAAKEKFQRNLRRGNISTWKDAAIKKGAPRVAQGARDAQPKMQQFMSEFLPHVATVQAQVNSIPKGGIDASEQRMIANMRGMAAFRRG